MYLIKQMRIRIVTAILLVMLFWHWISINVCMKRLILLPFFLCFFIACDSKKQRIYDNQKLINKQLAGLQDSLNHAGDSASLERMKSEVKVLQFQFDSLNNELEN